MPTPARSPMTEARTAMKGIIDAEFTDVPLVAKNDKLDTSLGQDGALVGIFPVREYPNPVNRMELFCEFTVQMFSRWVADDPTHSVDPAPIEAWVDRLRRALGAYRGAGDTNVWWFAVSQISYPDDPTGKRTRAELTVLSHGDNPAP